VIRALLVDYHAVVRAGLAQLGWSARPHAILA
jgi:hypothetical protein